MADAKKPAAWVQYNWNTDTYDTRDGTAVGAEIVNSVECLADVFRICEIREKQRANKEVPRG